MSANDMRKLMEQVSTTTQDFVTESNSRAMHEAMDDLMDMNEQMKSLINDFDNLLRQTVGYDDIIYNRFKSYPGGHIMSSLGEGGYMGNDYTLDSIISDIGERASEPEGQDIEDEEDELGEATAEDEVANDWLTNGAIKKIASACEHVWQTIAYDIMDEEVSAEVMIELATDGGRLEMNGYNEEQKMFQALADDHGYSTALKIVAKELPYGSYEAGGSQAL